MTGLAVPDARLPVIPRGPSDLNLGPNGEILPSDEDKLRLQDPAAYDAMQELLKSDLPDGTAAYREWQQKFPVKPKIDDSVITSNPTSPMEELHAQLNKLPPDQADKLIESLPPEKAKEYNDFLGLLVPDKAPKGSANEPPMPSKPIDQMSLQETEDYLKQHDPEFDPKSERTAFGNQMHDAAIITRGAGAGALTIPNLIDQYAVTPLIRKLGNPNEPTLSDVVGNFLDKHNIGVTEDSSDRVAKDISEGATGFLTGGMIGKGLVKTAKVLGSEPTLVGALGRGLTKVGGSFQKEKLLQAISGAIGGGAGGIERERGGSVKDQIIASLVGSLAPSAVIPAIGGAIRTGIRGLLPAVQANLQDFKTAGSMPTVGQLTGGHVANKIEEALTKYIGTSSIMARKAASQEFEVGSTARQAAETLRPNANPTKAGNAVHQALTNKLKPWASDMSNHYYTILGKVLPPDTMVRPDQYIQTLKKFVSYKPAVPADPELQRLAQELRLATRTTQGKIPLSSIRALKERIRTQINSTEVSTSNGQLKALEQALIQDEKRAAQAAGPRAIRAMAKAHKFTSDYHDILDIIEPILKKNPNMGDKVFQALTSGGKDGATLFHTVMQVLPPAERKLVAAAYIQKLFRAPGSKQVADQGGTDLSTAFSRMNDLSPTMKANLFQRFGPEFRRQFEAISRVAEKVRESPIEKNSNGSTGLYVLLSLGMSGAGGLGAATFGAGTAGVGLAGLAALSGMLFAPNTVAKLMTNPKFVEWLAKANTIPPAALPAASAQLAQQLSKSNDPDLQALGHKISTIDFSK